MSNKVCCVPGCSNSTVSKDVLHKFPNPAKDKDRFNTWVYSIGGNILALSNDHVFKYRRVCHKHFEEKYWCRNKLLSNIAVPTKNMPDEPSIASSELKENPTEVLISSGYEHVGDPGAVDDIDLPPPSPCPSEQAVCQEFAKPSAPPSPLQSTEVESAAPVFSWQQSELISADEVEVPPTVTELEEQSGVTLYCDESPAPRPLDPSDNEVEYRCNDCEDIIVGCQYWCVQCEPRARCAGCAARGAHDRHYVLRSPAHTPHWQTELLLAAIRQQLQNGNMLTLVDTDGVKAEVKVEELGDVESAPVPPDPLECAEETESGTTGDSSMEIDYLDGRDSTTPIHEDVVSRPELVDSRMDDDEEETEIVPSLIEHEPSASVSIMDDNERETEIVTSLIEHEPSASVSIMDDNERETEIVTSLIEHEPSASLSIMDDNERETEIVTSLIEHEPSASVSIMDDNERETEIVTSLIDHETAASVSESIFSNMVARRSAKRDSWRLLARDLTESMMRRSSEAVVELRPLSSAEIRKWMVHIKKKRK